MIQAAESAQDGQQQFGLKSAQRFQQESGRKQSSFKFAAKGLPIQSDLAIILVPSTESFAAVAQLVEHHVANVIVVGSNPISRSQVTAKKHVRISTGVHFFWALDLQIAPTHQPGWIGLLISLVRRTD